MGVNWIQLAYIQWRAIVDTQTLRFYKFLGICWVTASLFLKKECVSSVGYTL
jgi:hypothetical protein